MTAQEPRSRQQPKQLDAGIFQAEISSFALRLAAEGKAAKTIRTCTEAVQWFAAARLPGRARWEQVDRQDIQQWMASLLSRYGNAYASNQYQALQAVLQVTGRRRRAARPDGRAATATHHRQAGPGLHRRGADPAGTCLCGPQLRAAPRYRDHRRVPGDRHPAGWPSWPASATTPATRGTATSTCGSEKSPSAARAARSGIVRIGHQAARSLDRYLRARARHAQAWRPQL